MPEVVVKPSLPFLDSRSYVDLVGKARPWLSMQVPVCVCNSLWLDFGFRMVELVVGRSFNVNYSIDDGMVDVNSLRSKLPRQRLCERPHCKLASRKRCTQSRTFHSRSCRSKDESRWMFCVGVFKQ